MTYVGDYCYFVSWCIVFPSSAISAIFCRGFADLFKAATVLLRKVHDVCWYFAPRCII